MNISARTVVLIYLGLFATTIVAAIGINLFLASLATESESTRTAMIEFATSMTDMAEVSFGALIGTLSATLQRAFTERSAGSPKAGPDEPGGEPAAD